MSASHPHPAFSAHMGADANPWTHLNFPPRPDEYSFALLSDRTGLARPGVFESALDAVNLLRPELAIQVGDLIEGYTTDERELSTQWAEIDAMLARLETPLFHVPGNHDVSNDLMRAEWLRRYGRLHYHFVFRDTLFIVLDTQDPPKPVTELYPGLRANIDSLRALMQQDRTAALRMADSMIDWEGTHPACFSESQVKYVEEVVAGYPAVRWTFLLMHMPAWQGDGHPGFDRIRRALGTRSYTAFAGHVHNYRYAEIDGRAHIRLGPTGGTWVVRGTEGNFDHVTLVTLTEGGPRIANLVLDGILGERGGEFRPQQWPELEATARDAALLPA